MKKGTQQKWIWIIVFLPIVGCIAYLYSEVFNKHSSYQVYDNKKTKPLFGNNIKKLEATLKFSDTFKNRVALAEAYQMNNEIDKAIIIYEDSLQGNFKNDEYVTTQLIHCYYLKNEFEKIIPLAQSIYNKPQFKKSKAHIYYAIALYKSNYCTEAEVEFKLLNGKYSYFEARYQYAQFLISQNRLNDAKQILNDIISDSTHLLSSEKRVAGNWIKLAKQEILKL